MHKYSRILWGRSSTSHWGRRSIEHKVNKPIWCVRAYSDTKYEGFAGVNLLEIE